MREKKHSLALSSRYIAKTPLNQYLKISCDTPSESEEIIDKWNYWVFSISANTWLNGQKSYRSFNVWANASASRVTEESKVYFGVWGNYNENKYDYEDYNLSTGCVDIQGYAHDAINGTIGRINIPITDQPEIFEDSSNLDAIRLYTIRIIIGIKMEFFILLLMVKSSQLKKGRIQLLF